MADLDIIHHVKKHHLGMDGVTCRRAIKFIKHGMQEDVDLYMQMQSDPYYTTCFATQIEWSLNALQLCSNRLNEIGETT